MKPFTLPAVAAALIACAPMAEADQTAKWQAMKCSAFMDFANLYFGTRQRGLPLARAKATQDADSKEFDRTRAILVAAYEYPIYSDALLRMDEKIAFAEIVFSQCVAEEW